MKSGRLEAFSDGVLAIIITIMVLEMKAPEEPSLEALIPILPVFISYLISFIYLGIYWNNHHHMLQITEKVNGSVLWANLHLLFWLSLVPFVTSWVGENHLTAIPIVSYGSILLMSSIAYRILQITLMRCDPDNIHLKRMGSMTIKENVSTLLYIAAIPLAFVSVWVSIALYMVVAVIWAVPDKRVEKSLKESQGN